MFFVLPAFSSHDKFMPRVFIPSLLADMVIHFLRFRPELILSLCLRKIYVEDSWSVWFCLIIRTSSCTHYLTAEALCSDGDMHGPSPVYLGGSGGQRLLSCLTLWRPCQRQSLVRCRKWPSLLRDAD
jgi:hypothetical protein